jgi:hypothetical protein
MENEVKIALRELSHEQTFRDKLSKAGYEGDLVRFPVAADGSCVLLYVCEGTVFYNPLSVTGRPIENIKALLRAHLTDFAERTTRLREARRVA